MTGLITKKYGFMSRVAILCHFKELLSLYIYIYIIGELDNRMCLTLFRMDINWKRSIWNNLEVLLILN
jgi:hypothetical protein